MATPQQIFSFIVERAAQVTLPGLWSPIPCHPGWVNLPTTGLLDELNSRFEGSDLLAAGVVIQQSDQLIPNPLLEHGADLTFVVQTAPDAPYTILPQGLSLTTMPAWRTLLGDCRLRQRIAAKQPL